MNTKIALIGCLALIMVAGCAQEPSSAPAPSNSAVDGAAYRLPDEPAGAQDVIAVRDSAADGDDVLIVGRIGGATDPWIEGRAAFSIVDLSLKACSDIPGDACPTPWDYCCETDKLPAATALVKVVDQGGQLVNSDARQLLNLKELATVVVQGKAQRDDAGNLTVLASGVHVRE